MLIAKAIMVIIPTVTRVVFGLKYFESINGVIPTDSEKRNVVWFKKRQGNWTFWIGVNNCQRKVDRSCDKKAAKNYGVVKIDHKCKITDFQEKPASPRSTLVAMCLYYFPGAKLDLISDYITRKAGKHDATGFYIDWLSKKTQIFGFVFQGRWFDIGDHKFYNQAKEGFSNA